MELESLKRQISFLEKNDVEIGKLVTDRHTQVSAYMENENPQIEHTYDVWHVAKGTVSRSIMLQLDNEIIHHSLFIVTAIFILYILGEKKRLTKAAKLKKFSSLKPWIGVINKKRTRI